MRGRVGGRIPSRLAELIPILGLDGFSCPPSFKLNRKYRIHLLFSRANAAHERRIALHKSDQRHHRRRCHSHRTHCAEENGRGFYRT